MKARTIIYLLILTMLAISGSASAIEPVAVSPGNDPSTTLRVGEAVIGQGCPTFSWSSMEGAVAYKVEVFEVLTADIPSYSDMEAMAEPVISREIAAPALSWTPSSGECLSTGGSYVWYVQGIDSGTEYPDVLEGWSEGRGFEVDVSVSLAGMEEAVEGTVNEYLTNEWSSTESYREVKKVIKAEVLSDVEASGASGGLSIMAAVEGDAQQNTYYGTGAGASLDGTGLSNAFFGYNAGNQTTGGDYNTFIGRGAGLWNTTGSYNTFLGTDAGYSNTTGYYNTFIGSSAGNSNTDGDSNTFLGLGAGNSNTTGGWNTFLGRSAGNFNTTGTSNTFLGRDSGYSNQTGAGNVFLGYRAGYSETGSNRLYIDNFNTTTPLIYGEFDNDTVTINGSLGINTSTPAASLDTAGGDITVNGTDISAGTGPGTRRPGLSWAETGRINIGHGGAGGGNLEMYSKGHATRTGNLWFVYGGGDFGNISFKHYNGSAWTAMMLIDKDGNVGIGTETPAYPLELASGAHVTAGGVWTDASSRQYKENIENLRAEEAMEALKGLNPVKFNYKADKEERYAGFIAEDVPELVAMKDRKGLSPMDIVAVLTSVVKEQQRVAQEQQKTISELLEDRKEQKEIVTGQQRMITLLSEKVAGLEREFKLKGSLAMAD